jgi:hypothetical protein
LISSPTSFVVSFRDVISHDIWPTICSSWVTQPGTVVGSLSSWIDACSGPPFDFFLDSSQIFPEFFNRLFALKKQIFRIIGMDDGVFPYRNLFPWYYFRSAIHKFLHPCEPILHESQFVMKNLTSPQMDQNRCPDTLPVW